MKIWGLIYYASKNVRSSRPEVFCKKCVLRNFPKFAGSTCARVTFLLKKRLWHRCPFSCEFCEISKNTFSYRTPPVAASERWEISWWEDNKEMTIINWRAFNYSSGTCGKNCEVPQNFRVSLDEKEKNNLKLLKCEIL